MLYLQTGQALPAGGKLSFEKTSDLWSKPITSPIFRSYKYARFYHVISVGYRSGKED
jgi:hypothetical protein